MKSFKQVLLVAFVASVHARCNNDCSGNGICNAGSVCECELNFIGNDCSDRLCLYGKAFIDSPLGNLNGDKYVDTDQQIWLGRSNGLVGEQYPPEYALARADNKQAWNEAHFYQECSNKGICDRTTGQCACFPGFEGEGCRRITCPNSCSGHGQCVSMSVMNADYAAWDEKKTVMCTCDPGYTGADCSLRKCASGVDPISTVYTHTESVYKVEWKQQTGTKWGAAEHPNGQVHWTMSYTDDYGDIWTTSAVTTYYQARDSAGSLKVGPHNKDKVLTCTPFFMDPDYQGQDVKTVSVDGGLKVGGSAEGTGIKTVYAAKKFSFHQSFIGEQVNASIHALPNDLVRYAYVHTVYNYAPDQDEVFIYPSMGVPKFKTKLNAKTLQVGVTYAQGAGVCSADTPATADCSNTGNFNAGRSLAVNDVKYRFPFFIATTDTTQGPNALAVAYTKCAQNNLCVFITIPEPKGSKTLTVNYKFKTMLRTTKANAAEKEMKPNEYDVAYAAEVANHDQGTGSLVSVAEVGSDRKWHKLIDGTPTKKFDSAEPLYMCSRRGLCDYETGTCKCFDGYSGYKCQQRSVLGL